MANQIIALVDGQVVSGSISACGQFIILPQTYWVEGLPVQMDLPYLLSEYEWCHTHEYCLRPTPVVVVLCDEVVEGLLYDDRFQIEVGNDTFYASECDYMEVGDSCDLADREGYMQYLADLYFPLEEGVDYFEPEAPAPLTLRERFEAHKAAAASASASVVEPTLSLRERFEAHKAQVASHEASQRFYTLRAKADAALVAVHDAFDASVQAVDTFSAHVNAVDVESTLLKGDLAQLQVELDRIAAELSTLL